MSISKITDKHFGILKNFLAITTYMKSRLESHLGNEKTEGIWQFEMIFMMSSLLLENQLSV